MILEIFVPENATCLLKADNKVDFKEDFYEEKQSELIEIDVVQKTKIPPKKIFKYLKKFVGDNVEKGDLLVQVKSFFSNLKITSPVSGIIKEVDHQSGKIKIDSLGDKASKVMVFFKAEIAEVKKNQIKIKIGKADEREIKKANKSFGGKTVFLKNQTLISELVENKIIVAKEINSFDQVKLEALGAKGFITLKSLPEQTNLPFAEVKDWPESDKFSSDFSYCLVVKENSKMYFYK